MAGAVTALDRNWTMEKQSAINLRVAEEAVAKVNAHDVAGIIALMTSDYVFVDSLGNKFTRPAIDAGWQRYFSMVPDYRLKIDHVVPDGNAVILFGAAGGTYVPNGGAMKPENKWDTPAVWRAVIRDGKIAEWRVYCDNEPIRAKIRAGQNPRPTPPKP